MTTGFTPRQLSKGEFQAILGDIRTRVGPPTEPDPDRPKRKYEPENPCPHIKADGEPCGAGVMEGSEKCATHSGLTSPKVRDKRRRDLLKARYMEPGRVEGDDVDLTKTLNRALGSLQRATDDIAGRIEELSSEDQQFRDWWALTKDVHKLASEMKRLGQTDRALDAAEVMATPVWSELLDAVSTALEPFPDAYAAVFHALAGINPPEPPALSAGPVVAGEVVE